MHLKTMIRIAPLLLALIAINGVAQEDSTPELIKKSLSAIIPSAPDGIRSSEAKGIYEVQYGNNYYYISEDGRYLITGDLIKLNDMSNLTESRRNEGRKQFMSELNENEMIVYKANGEQKHVVTVFTDIDCGYCRKLHSGMQEMNDLGITIRYLAYPRAGLNSESYRKAVSVWCAKDKQAAMDFAKKTGNAEKSESCENPVVKHMMLGKKFGVSGTPALLLADGTLIPGYQPPKKLLETITSK